MRNGKESYEGYYYGTDMDPKTGFFVSSDQKKFGEILVGDSIESLKKLNTIIHIFINDSDHSAEYEEKE